MGSILSKTRPRSAGQRFPVPGEAKDIQEHGYLSIANFSQPCQVLPFARQDMDKCAIRTCPAPVHGNPLAAGDLPFFQHFVSAPATDKGR